MEKNPNKLNYLMFLTSPRIFSLHISNNSRSDYIFKLTPSKLCYSHGLEHYFLQYDDMMQLTNVF